MDERPKIGIARKRAFLALEKRRPRKADQHHVRPHDLLHGKVHHAALRAVALVDKDEDVSLCLETRRQFVGKFLEVNRSRPFAPQSALAGIKLLLWPVRAKLVNQSCDKPLARPIQCCYQVGAACRAIWLLAGLLEAVCDLLVEFVAVGDYHHPRIWPMLLDPLRKPNHRKRFAGALRMPDDARLLAHDTRLRRLQREKLRGPHHLLNATVKHNAIVYKGEKPLLVEHLQHRLVQQRLDAPFLKERRLITHFAACGVLSCAWARAPKFLAACGEVPPAAAGLFPLQPVFLGRESSRILQPLRFIARHQELRRGKKRRNLPRLLVAVVLANSLGHAHIRLLELDHAKGNAIDPDHDIWPAMSVCRDLPSYRHFLGYGEVVFERMLPVDEINLFHRLARLGGNRHRVSEGQIHIFVYAIEVGLTRACHALRELGYCTVGVCRLELLLADKKLLQRLPVETGVLALRQVAKILIAKLCSQKLNDAILNRSFGGNPSARARVQNLAFNLIVFHWLHSLH